ncbi:prephenate/arogenate dehydrogenase family protein [Sphingomonas canadensis]|uniref:Prephenate/arogenate dehydrogenase family protein n=1 Tax=Sphingomonas canadensis TaxID=1219257 RepID=A0ABW3H1D5_9SPHN|nr:prephenate/arogenate dehydrogenase family protein [Sphingomonas canadensis]MCW3834861.1 prephenate/arogenate dehydrogenase family protein [Sphingomonas canadensis]
MQPAPSGDALQPLPFGRVTIIGLGLIGSSIARAVRLYMPGARVTGYDADPAVRDVAVRLSLCDAVADTPGAAVADAEFVIFCVPVGAMGEAAASIAAGLPANAVVSDVGSCKESVVEALSAALPGAIIVPAHPVAGTENSGPESGFASLFRNRWCIVTPAPDAPALAVSRVVAFWEQIGAEVETMEPHHHDRVLAVTSHLPHLIAYTIVGTASDLEEVTRSEVIKYSAGGFRDFTRIAASDPTMWRDVFLANKEAVLDMLQRFSEDLSALQRAIRWGKGDELFDLFTRTRAIRRSILEEGQDDARPDFGRAHE